MRRRWSAGLVALLLLAGSLGALRHFRGAAAAPQGTAEDALRFLRRGTLVKSQDRAALALVTPEVALTVNDPYYGRRKRFRALALAPLLQTAFGEPLDALRGADFVLRARDGYTVPLAGARLLEGGAFVAVADEEVAGWEPIGPQRASPGPFYLIWEGEAQRDLTTHPRPWQLAAIEIADLAATFPHTAPTGVPEGAPAQVGFRLFRAECLRCHAINREGGRVGPELNVPQSIVEYRPEAQIRAYIKDPRTFRYGNMPAQPQLGEQDLDALLAYFRAMSERKHDPEAAGRGK